jgi:hypothetical protein
VGVIPEDWQGDATTQTYIAKTVVNTMIDTVAPKYHSTDVEAWGRIMRGNASAEERAKYGNMSPVTAKSLYGVAHQRRAELRGIISYFGSAKVQAEAMQGLERHPSFRKSGGAQVYFGKLVSAARGYMEKNAAPTTDGLCAAIDREVESMCEKADGPKPTKSTVEQVNALREAVSAALRKLQALEENKYLSKAVAAAVETMVQENTMIPATPVEDQPKVKRAERRAKVKPASKPVENAAPKGWDAADGGVVQDEATRAKAKEVAADIAGVTVGALEMELLREKAEEARKPKEPRVNAKATLDADELSAL